MTKKRPPQKKTAPTDELNILAVQPSPQKVEPQAVDPREPSLDTSSVPVTFDSPQLRSQLRNQSDSSALLMMSRKLSSGCGHSHGRCPLSMRKKRFVVSGEKPIHSIIRLH
jgi:hypothetical protein